MCICVLSVVSLSAMSTQHTQPTIKLETKRKGKRGIWAHSGLVLVACLTKKDTAFSVNIYSCCRRLPTAVFTMYVLLYRCCGKSAQRFPSAAQS